MPSVSRVELAGYAACAVVIAVLGLRALREDAAPAPAARGAGAPPGVTVRPRPPVQALVHVVGAVRRPGVYRMEAGSRIQDAVTRAGGASARADLAGLNLAAKVADAQQIIVPRRAPAGTAAGTGSTATAPAAAGAGAPAGAAGPVNLNSAGIEQLETLDGVGPVTARKILEYRAAHGGFRSIEDLAQVPGIGPKRLAAIKPRVTL